MHPNWTSSTIKTAVAVSVLASVVYGFSSGPPAGNTGAPGEATCVQCHIGTLNGGPGRVTISGVPAEYAPNEQFTLTVRVEHPDRRRWGFQLTALDGGNRSVGTLEPVDRHVAQAVGGTGGLQGRRYVEHTSNGTFSGQAQGAEWEVRWTAPDHDVGRVTFYAAGNAANGNNASSGDSIYTTSVATGSTAPMVVAAVYKKGKIVLQANGSNIEAGATLEISGGTLGEPESFPLVANASGTRFLVKKSARSTPGGRSVDDVLPEGSSVTIAVRNPDGAASAPATLER